MKTRAKKKRARTIHRLMLGATAAGALAALACGDGGTTAQNAPVGTYCNSTLSNSSCENHNVGQNCCAQYNGNNCIVNSVCTGPYENDTTPDRNHQVNAICSCNK